MIINDIKRRWKQQTLKNQIFLSMLLITFLGVVILGNVAYKISVDIIERNYKISYESTLQNTSKVMDMNLKNIIEAARDFLNNMELREVLENSNYGGHVFSRKDQRVLYKVAESLSRQQVWINSIVFMDLFGHCYKLNNINSGTYDFYKYYENSNFMEEDWCEKAKLAKGKEIFIGSDLLPYEKKNVFYLAKYMINPSSRKPMGYLIISISQKLLSRSLVISGERYQSSCLMVVDTKDNDELVYFDRNSGNCRTQEILNAYTGNTINSKYLFSNVKNNSTGWDIVNVIEKNELSREGKQLRILVFEMGALVVFLGFILAKAISMTITRPLKQLENIIFRVGEGERHIEEEFDYSEVGRIGQKFKEMVNTNLELSEHLMAVKLNEREAELLLLQSQINPHYLYNTLDSLYCVAIMHGDDQIAEMIMALSNNFKLALNNGEKYITVADSIKWVEEYMKLQNMRYNNRFELFIDIERAILPRKTISFILQPFIENAMNHGLEPKIGKGKIKLLGRQDGNKIVFTIEDDGVGIADMSVLDNGYGISNVRERIRLNYGENYGVKVESEKGKGTVVTVIVPMQ